MHFADSPHSEIIPSKTPEVLPRVEAVEATSTALHQFYEAWDSVYAEINDGTPRQSTQHFHADSPVLGTSLIRSGVGNDLNAAKLWRLSDPRDPAVRVQLSLYNKEADDSYTRMGHTMLLRASGLAAYEITQAKVIKYAPTSLPMIIKQTELAKRTPSIDDLLLFDDALRLITTAETISANKQRFATRLGDWLFNSHI